MIYEQPELKDTLSQGDIVDGCPILFWEYPANEAHQQPESASMSIRVVVLTQACDLAQAKATRVLVAVVHQVQGLIEQGFCNPR